MDDWTNGWKNRQREGGKADRKTERQTDRRTDGRQAERYGWIDMDRYIYLDRYGQAGRQIDIDR